MRYFKFEVKGWIKSQAVHGASLKEAQAQVPNADLENSYGWEEVSYLDYLEIIQSY